MAGFYVKPIGSRPGNLLRIEVDPGDAFKRQFSALEQKHVPAALTRAVVHTAQELQRDWARTMQRVFKNPTPFTQKAVRYKIRSGTQGAEIFIRDEASNGTPPARYLMPQVRGGQRLMKPFENLLRKQGILPAGMQAVPGKGQPLDAFGNIPPADFSRMLSQLGARRDEKTNETDTSRRRRLRREKKRQELRGSYFVIKPGQGRMLPGVYQRENTGGAAREALGVGSQARSVLIFTKPGNYSVRYRIFDRAEAVYRTTFPKFFEHALKTEIDLSGLGLRR
jgi:hypothetical protein